MKISRIAVIFSPVLLGLAGCSSGESGGVKLSKKDIALQEAATERFKQQQAENAVRVAEILAKKEEMKSVERYGVYIGMRAEEAEQSLGRPKRKNRSVGTWGTHEQWVYESGAVRYLYIENGSVTSFEN